MEQRKGLLNKKHRFFFWIFVSSLLIMVIFLARLFFISYQYGSTIQGIKYAPVIGLFLWFLMIYFLFKEWGNSEFSGFISRLHNEIQEVMDGERKNIFFRKKDPWKIENLKNVISNKLEKIRELERVKLIQTEEFNIAQKENDFKKARETSDTLKDVLDHAY